MEWANDWSSNIHYDPDWSIFRFEVPVNGTVYAYSSEGPQMETMMTLEDLDSSLNYEELQNDHSAFFNVSAYNIFDEDNRQKVYNLYNSRSTLNWCTDEEGELYIDGSLNKINILINVNNQQDTMQCMGISIEDVDEIFNYDTPWDFVPNYNPDSIDSPFKDLLYDIDINQKIAGFINSLNYILSQLGQINTGKFVDFSTVLVQYSSGSTYFNGDWISGGTSIFYKIPRFTEIELTLSSSAQHIGIFDNTPHNNGQLAYLSCNPIYNYDEPGTYARQLTWDDTDKSGSYKFINNSDKDLYICWENGHNPTNFSINGYNVISNGVYDEDIPLYSWETTLTQRLMSYITRMNEAVNELLEQ